MRRNKGFTLVEIIVVLVVMSILAAISVPAVLGYIDDAKNAQYIAEGRCVLLSLQSQLTKDTASNGELPQIDDEYISKVLKANDLTGELKSENFIPKSDGEFIDKFWYQPKDLNKYVYYDGKTIQVVNSIESTTDTFDRAEFNEALDQAFENLPANLKSQYIYSSIDNESSRALKANLEDLGFSFEEAGMENWYFLNKDNKKIVYWYNESATSGSNPLLMKYNISNTTNGNNYDKLYSIWYSTGVIRSGQTVYMEANEHAQSKSLSQEDKKSYQKVYNLFKELTQ